MNSLRASRSIDFSLRESYPAPTNFRQHIGLGTYAPARCTAVKSVSAGRRLRHLRRQAAAEVSRLHRLCHLGRPDFVRQPKRQRLFHRRASHRPSVGKSRQTGYLIPLIRLFTSGCFFLKSSSIFLSRSSEVLPVMIPRLNAQ